MVKRWRGIIEEYRAFLPVSDKTPVITLGEGNTPLVKAEKLPKHLKIDIEIHFKLEGLNPTGSFKDRGMTMAVSKALEEGSKTIICASTGNTSASAAAYGAKAGMKVIVIVPAEGIALGKLAQALIYGATVIPIKGNFDACSTIVREISQKYPITIVNSLNPYRVEGQKTAAFEICQQLGEFPDYHFIPVGNAANIWAYWRGYCKYADYTSIDINPFSLPPKMMGWQASGAAPIAKSYPEIGEPVKNPKTIASAIRIGNPARWREAVAATATSGGTIGSVTDREILSAYSFLAREEGVFCEPASAAAVAGLIKSVKLGMIKQGSIIVCTLTGNGLKDTDTALKEVEKPESVDADFKKVVKTLKL